MRSTVIGLAVACLGALAGTAGAQESTRVHRVGILGNTPAWQALEADLARLGWVEGRNLRFERRASLGVVARHPELAADLVRLEVDVIVAISPPAVRAAQEATGAIPIVMTAVADPVGAGFVASLARPGGNITGVASSAGAGFMAKQLELTKEAVPGATEIGLLFNAGNPLNYAAANSAELGEAARALGVRLHRLAIENADELAGVFESASRARLNAIIVTGDPLTFARRDEVQDLAERHRLPTVHPTREYLAGRGFMSHGPSLDGLLRAVAPYVDRILRGAKPADLPVEQPTGYELVVNLRTARALGIDVPRPVLARADEVIE